MKEGKKCKLRVLGNFSKVKWKSTNKKVASVSKKGLVTAKKYGKSKIVVTVRKSRKLIKKLICKVSVIKENVNQRGNSSYVSDVTDNKSEVKDENSLPNETKNGVVKAEVEKKHAVVDGVSSTPDTDKKKTGNRSSNLNTAIPNTGNVGKSQEQIEQEISLKPLQYQVHIQNSGWKEKVNEGETAGSTGESKRLEAIKIWLNDNLGNSAISYRVHCAYKGWLPWCKSGEMSGTTGEERQIEAVEIKLDDKYQALYDIYYRIHLKQLGWLGWSKNGELSGSTGCDIRGEAIQIKVVKKGVKFDVGEMPHFYEMPKLSYKTYLQNSGWNELVTSGNTSGSTGESKRMEALVINLKDDVLGDMVSYSTHLSDVGWTKDVNSGEISGTTGQSRAIEAVKVNLKGKASELFDIFYRVHVQNYGWLGWTKKWWNCWNYRRWNSYRGYSNKAMP